jgi:hypothetical protein
VSVLQASLYANTDELFSAVVLAYNFDIRDGHVDVTAPDVITGDDFSLVCK